MGTFMDKLKGKGLVEKGSAGAPAGAAPASGGQHMQLGHHDMGHAMQLPVDVYQADRDIIIFSQMAGIDMSSLDVSITGENDIITISGKMVRPEHLAHESVGEHADGDYTLEECHWGDFYRQIILPEEIDPEGAEAKTKDGVLILRLPLKGAGSRGLKLNVVRLDSRE
jgi:HSP20 family molecular chaperone IbpA